MTEKDLDEVIVAFGEEHGKDALVGSLSSWLLAVAKQCGDHETMVAFQDGSVVSVVATLEEDDGQEVVRK